jgi:enoyl-CoA hydratase
MVTPADTGAYETIRVVADGAVDWLTLNRPDRLNAITDQMVFELWDYFTAKQSDHKCRVIVMTGAGDAFCAGLDLKASAQAQTASPAEREKQLRGASLFKIVKLMRSCPQPIVSLVKGAACGGGFVLALASDIRLAGRSARMNVAFAKLGLSGCELGVSYFLPRTVGLSVARELMMTGRFIGAERALATGLVSEVVADEELPATAQVLLKDMLLTSPTGLRRTKETFELTLEMGSLEAVMRLEEHTQLLCLQSPDFAEARAAFLEKRPPRFAA